MKTKFRLATFILLLPIIAVYYYHQAKVAAPLYPSGIALVDEDRFLISNRGEKTIALYSFRSDKPILTWSFDESPTGVFASGDYVYVTTFEEIGKLHFLNIKTGKTEKSIIVGSGVNTSLISPDGNFLIVLNQFQNNVMRIDLNSREITATTAVLREPRGAVIDRDGKYLFVANFLPNQASDSDNVCASISVIDLNGFIRIKDILLPNGSSALRGITLSPDGKFLLATHNLGRYALPTNQLLQRWMNSNAMSLMFIMLGLE